MFYRILTEGDVTGLPPPPPVSATECKCNVTATDRHRHNTTLPDDMSTRHEAATDVESSALI